MKRGPSNAWPRGIVEVPAEGPDPRVDPQATQKISREELEEALKRTKSGTRPAVRSRPRLEAPDEPERVAPRDDGPEVTIVRIDSVEIETVDPSALQPRSPTPTPSEVAASTPQSAMPVIITTPMEVAAALARPASGSHAITSPGGQGAKAAPARAIDGRRAPTQRLQITPRTAVLGAIVVAAIVALAALLGFFAGRGVPGLS